MNHKEICHKFFYQEGKNSSNTNRNIYYIDDIIYRYGSHFPMAKLDYDKNVVFFTTRGYSVSTSKHLNYLRQAIPSQYIVIFTDNPTFHLRDIFDDIQKEVIFRVQTYIQLKRKNTYKAEGIHTEAVNSVDNLKKFCKAYKYKSKLPYGAKKAIADLLNSDRPDTSVADEKQRYRNETMEENKRVANEKREAQYIADVDEWRKHGLNSINTPYGVTQAIRLSINNKHIETSGSMRIGLKNAIALYKALKAEKLEVGYLVDELYRLNGIEGDIVTIGCHRLSLRDMERLYKTLEKGGMRNTYIVYNQQTLEIVKDFKYYCKELENLVGSNPLFNWINTTQYSSRSKKILKTLNIESGE